MNPNVVERVLKMKVCQMADDLIAKRMELTVEEVRSIVADAIQSAESSKVNGHRALSDAYTAMCFQYQLLGDSLKVVAGALSNAASPQEIKSVLAGSTNPEAALLDNFIILRKFVAPPVQEAKKN